MQGLSGEVSMSTGAFPISAVAFEEEGVWVAQCLEYDICAQAKTLPKLHEELMRVIVGTLAVCVELGKEPFEGFDPAPQHFWKLFQSSSLKVEGNVIPLRTPTPLTRFVSEI